MQIPGKLPVKHGHVGCVCLYDHKTYLYCFAVTINRHFLKTTQFFFGCLHKCRLHCNTELYSVHKYSRLSFGRDVTLLMYGILVLACFEEPEPLPKLSSMQATLFISPTECCVSVALETVSL